MHYASAPAAVARDSGWTEVYIRGTDDVVYYKQWRANSWSGWMSAGGLVTSSPAACTWGGGRVDLFARGQNGALWHAARLDGGTFTFSAWENLGGDLSSLSSPGAVSWGPDRIDIFFRGSDDGIWHKSYRTYYGWSGLDTLGGIHSSGPGVSSWASGQLNVVTRGLDANLWYNGYNGAWTGWQLIGGGMVSSAPAAASWGPNRIDVFVRGTDDALWWKWWDGSAWRP
jgi:hypothetical protein